MECQTNICIKYYFLPLTKKEMSEKNNKTFIIIQIMKGTIVTCAGFMFSFLLLANEDCNHFANSLCSFYSLD